MAGAYMSDKNNKRPTRKTKKVSPKKTGSKKKKY